MFIPPPGMNAGAAERAQQQSRGYVLGIILLVLFLSSQDFSPPARRHRVEAAKGIHEGMSKHREDVKEKVSAHAEHGPNPNDKNGKSRAPNPSCPETHHSHPSRPPPKTQIIVDLSASNERLETENRKLKVAAIGMMATLRELGHPADAAELNVSGMGLYSGHDDGDKSTEDVSTDKEKGAGGAPRKAGPALKKPSVGDGGTETERRLRT
jgi:hypothetical protein|tara:strand:+ start:335 stop:964 length:630 start_codon:yes stop_codon:yes gene_type:complete